METLPVVVAVFFDSSVLAELVTTFFAGLSTLLLRRGIDLTGRVLLGDCGCMCPVDIWRTTLGAWSSPTLIFLVALLPSSTVLARPTTAIEDRLLTADVVVVLVGDVRVTSAVALLGEDSVVLVADLGIWDRPTAPDPLTVGVAVLLTATLGVLIFLAVAGLTAAPTLTDVSTIFSSMTAWTTAFSCSSVTAWITTGTCSRAVSGSGGDSSSTAGCSAIFSATGTASSVCCCSSGSGLTLSEDTSAVDSATSENKLGVNKTINFSDQQHVRFVSFSMRSGVHN